MPGAVAAHVNVLVSPRPLAGQLAFAPIGGWFFPVASNEGWKLKLLVLKSAVGSDSLKVAGAEGTEGLLVS